MTVQAPVEDAARYTIDQLATVSGLTTRNIRAHQTRGLLPAPEVRGRTGYYGPDHLARLQLIREMQEKGFKLTAIQRILAGVPAGSGVDALDFERALLTWQTEQPEIVSAGALAERIPLTDPAVVERIERMGLLARLPDGERYEILSPMLLSAAEELVRLGLPLEAGLAVHEELSRHSRGVARAFVRLFVEQVWRPFEARGQPESEWPRVREALDRMRPLAEQTLLATFRMVMDREAASAFGRDTPGTGSTSTSSPRT
jgi:DNA-binding transcriptional MerR regulator